MNHARPRALTALVLALLLAGATTTQTACESQQIEEFLSASQEDLTTGLTAVFQGLVTGLFSAITDDTSSSGDTGSS